MDRPRVSFHAAESVLILALFAGLAAGCVKAPPNLAPDVVPYWNANEAVLALTTLGQAARGLNAITVCPPKDPSIGGIITCPPLLSTENTRTVGDVLVLAIQTITAAPDGWCVTALAALDSLKDKLDAPGLSKLKAYLDAARAILRAIL